MLRCASIILKILSRPGKVMFAIIFNRGSSLERSPGKELTDMVIKWETGINSF